MGFVGGLLVGMLYSWSEMIRSWKKNQPTCQSWFSWFRNGVEFLFGTVLGGAFGAIAGTLYGPFAFVVILFYCLFRMTHWMISLRNKS